MDTLTSTGVYAALHTPLSIVVLVVDAQKSRVHSNVWSQVNGLQGNFAASHVERDEAAGLTFSVVWDLTVRGMGMYSLFCVPDSEDDEPYLLAKVQDEPCYIHRCVL